MGSDRRPDLVSPFDDMLEENRRQFEDLSNGMRSRTAPGTASEVPAVLPAPATSTPARPATRARDSLPAPRPASSDAVRFLNDRYGDGWRYEITDRRREGDEVVVLCKLVIEDQHITKSQFGTSRIDQVGDGEDVKGSAGGIVFSVQSAKPPAAPSGNPVDQAFRRAEAAALANCAALL